MSHSERVEVLVLLTVGDDAIVVVPARDDREVRMPSAVIAGDAGIPVGELPGRRFAATWTQVADREYTLGEFVLLNDPRV
ncbi:hypothetical protein [Actinomadura rupiterrae]|uniref:hypothetical protein n=1 Tax=Actinomadura rupiterrae TaxID=559627 RepID=UPI0020A503B3|nr:hypothetical protein [Actinomadura rupiterrae]MCP2339187.1 hypothetical protein [Actinomadura rupiterrae]